MITSTHLFTGGAGTLCGFIEAGYDAELGINHDADSIATLLANFTGLRAMRCDINNLDFRSIPRTAVLEGSPICTELSPAGRNSTERKQLELAADRDHRPPAPDFSRTRATAWDLIRADEVHDYDVVCGENVIDFATRWRLFDAWLNVWDALGKNIQIVSVNAAHIAGDDNPAAPQLRNRVLFCFSKKGLPLPDLSIRPASTCTACGPVKGLQRWGKRFDKPGIRKVGAYGPRNQYVYVCPTARCHRIVEPVVRTIREHLDLTAPGRRLGDGQPHRRKFEPYSPETHRKVALGLDQFDEPFIVIQRNHSTVSSLDQPLSTLATGNHHLLVTPAAKLDDCEVRQLDVRERARIQRFPDSHVFAGNADSSQKRQVGNAVPVNVARWKATRIRQALEAAA
ncbi:MAG: DNA cytosine methyltransferase [Streptomycetaceae bacterium]|nr:DNA cytosine methyltransferase [Streptomycetaceae bacterium]